MSILGVVDLVTIVPVFVALFGDPVVKSPTGFVRLYRVLMLARVFKPFRLLRAVETLTPGNDAVLEQTAKTMAYFVSTLFLASGLVQVLSDGRTDEWGDVSDTTKLTFHDSLYFIIVTFSTVGYGDISPPDTQSRLAILLLVGFFFFMIPRELNKLNHLLDLSSKYTGVYPKKLAGGHTIVGCDVASCALVTGFLEEFFHEDHGYNIMHLVLLIPHEPTMEWKRLVLKFATNDRVTYLKGDLRNTTDLTRASAHTASSCFILTNRHGNLREEEKRGFMRAITVQDFNPTLRIFVEAPTQEMRQRLVKVSASIDEQRDMPSWVKEYACGLGKEIYVVSIGAFAGRGFSDLVRELFELHGVILLGISEDRRVVLHPGADYIITEADLGFLVADDADVAESIVEQAVGALLPFSQTTPASPSPGTAKGFAGEGPKRLSGTSSAEGTQTRPGSTANTTLGVASDGGARSAGARGTPARYASGPGRCGADSGGANAPKRCFPEDPAEQEGAPEMMVRDNGNAKHRGNTPTLLALDPPSSPSTGRKYTHNDAALRGGLRQGSTVDGRRISIERGSGVGKGSNGGFGDRSSASPTMASAGNGATANNGGGGDGDEEYVVLLTPTLEQVSLLVAALEAPQVPKMGVVVVCPLYDWNQERDEEEIRRLREFSQVRLVVGPAGRASLREAGASGARMVVVRAGKSFPDQEASDADAEHIGQLVEVTAIAGSNVRAIVELNDMTYGNHYEILVDLLRSSKPPTSRRSAHARPPPPPLPPPPPVENRGRRDTAAAVDEQPQQNSNFSPSLTWEGFGNFTLSSSAAVYFRRGGADHSRRRWWRRLFGGGGGGDSPEGPLDRQGGEGSDRQGTRPSACGLSTLGGSTVSRPTGAAAAEAAASPGNAKEGRRARVHWTLTKGVASGAIVPSSLPETLLCQAFYNPAIIMIVEALLDPKGQGYGKGTDSEKIRRRCRNDKGEDAKGEGVGEASGCGENLREERQERNGGRGEASFLAQILPPKRFFTQATLGGHRPNFQALMRFMLEEYDALPFGLLRHGKMESPCGTAEEAPKFVHCCPNPGQKVMPLDKVFLLAPNLGSWERMQLDSPSPTGRNRSADFPPGSRPGPTTLCSKSPNSGNPTFQSRRGFPPEPPGTDRDNRGFPILPGDKINHRNDDSSRPAASSPSRQRRGNSGGGGGGDGGGTFRGTSCHKNIGQISVPSSPSPGLPRMHRNLFPSPFSSTLPPETAPLATMNKFDENCTSWMGRSGKEGGGGAGAGAGGGADFTGPESPPPPSPSRQTKGSHKKLDLLLHEMRRLNGRLDMIVDQLGALEEKTGLGGT
eukprot:g16523.t1